MVWVVAPPRANSHSFGSVWLSSWRNISVSVLASSASVATELHRDTVLTGLGWNALCIALHEKNPLIQLSSLTGVAGLSFLTVMTSAIAVATVKRLSLEARGGRIRAPVDFTLTLALVVAAFGYGLRQLGPAGETIPLKVAAVQPSIPQDEKWNPAFEQRIYDTFERLTATATAMEPDLLLWPEAATPRGFFEDPVANAFVKKHAGSGKHALMFGSLILSHEADYNAAILMVGAEPEPQVYPKSHLVMFGEYVPLRESFPLFAIIVGDQVPADFDAGEGPVIFHLTEPHVAISPLICFEDTIGYLARAGALEGAQMFVTLTNTGWFRQTAAGRQHLAHAVFRCAETRRPMA
ncbi:MAG: apolipoprotein N-acyltransferase, partial [Chthoniobacterales bacterium]